ncbi:unnamed protein product [Discula destructiva]
MVQILNLAQNGVAIWGATAGVGTPDTELNVVQMIRGGICVLIWQLCYICGSNFIKSSVCASLERVAAQRGYTYILRAMIALFTIAGAASITIYTQTLVHCHHVLEEADPSTGACIQTEMYLVLYINFASLNLLTDLVVGILPIFMVWNVQMPAKLKIATATILGLGLLASVATIAGLPYSAALSSRAKRPKDVLETVAHIMIWSIIECNLGMIAGSLPMALQHFGSLSDRIRASTLKNRDVTLAFNGTLNGRSTELLTIGRTDENRSTLRLHTAKYQAEIMVNVIGHFTRGRSSDEGDSCQRVDENSTRQLIFVRRSIEQTSHSRTGHCGT